MGGRSEETYWNYVDEHDKTQGRVQMDCERVLGKSTSMIYNKTIYEKISFQTSP